MDAATLSTLLMAVVTGASEALGGKLWENLTSLVRRPFRRKSVRGSATAAVASGEAEVLALQQSPRDLQKALALAEALLARANADADFGQALESWWIQAGPVRMSIGNATNVISGGTQNGPVLQGKDFSNLTFGVAAPPVAPEQKDDAAIGGEARNVFSGGKQGTAVQGQYFINPIFVTNQTNQVAAAPESPMQLPPLVDGFTGRDAELATVTGWLNPLGDTGPAVVSVVGLPGVGKTAIAIHAAHAACTMGRFPGGVLFKDLHGYDDKAVQPPEALEELLLALDIPREYIPDGMEARAGRYRSALAQRTDALLIVTDNASSESQVQPLLPGPGPHRVIVTSRHTLAGLSAPQEDVMVLDKIAGAELLDRALRAVRSDDCRISGDSAAAERLTALCGGLPLALRITAELLAADHALTASELADELADEASRLEALSYDDGGAGGLSVAAAFQLSYRKLDETAARVFRLLPIDPGPDVSTMAVAVLAADSPGRTRKAIGQLLKAHLVEPNDNNPTRWRMHDLLRLYARKLSDADPGEQDLARNRLLSYYHSGAAYVDSILTRQPPPQAVVPPVSPVSHNFADRRSALDWARAELPNLLACADYVVHHAEDPHRHQEKAWAVLFASALAGILRNEGLWSRSIEIQTLAMNAAEQINAPMAVANVLSERALLYRLTGELERAVNDLERAIAIYRQIGNEIGEAHALDTYGVVLDQLGRQAESIQKHSSALDIYRRLDNRLGEANVLQDQGMTQLFAKNFAEAMELFSQALTLYQEIDQPLGSAHAHAYLARAQSGDGLQRAAEESLESAEELYREIGNQAGVVTTLIQRGTILRQHDRRQANQVLNKARQLSSDIGNQIGLVNALDQLAELRMARPATRRFAIDLWMWALETTRKYGLQREEAKLVDKLNRLGLISGSAAGGAK
jgi:tetratricopeptide (TPR) repeat protein